MVNCRGDLEPLGNPPIFPLNLAGEPVQIQRPSGFLAALKSLVIQWLHIQADNDRLFGFLASGPVRVSIQFTEHVQGDPPKQF